MADWQHQGGEALNDDSMIRTKERLGFDVIRDTESKLGVTFSLCDWKLLNAGIFSHAKARSTPALAL